jgi:hypothetical protein
MVKLFVDNCEFKDCSNLPITKGLCTGHYQQRLKGKELKPLQVRGGAICSFGTCVGRARSKGLCDGHGKQRRRGQELRPLQRKADKPTPSHAPPAMSKCAVSDCLKHSVRNGAVCNTHGHRAKKYGLTIAQFLALPKACQVCGSTHRLHIDHDHSCCDFPGSCGQCVRGVLCHRCNMALGACQDDRSVITGLLNYLEKQNKVLIRT